jgi:hypothetical protein
MSVSQHVNQVLTDIAKKMGGGKVRVGFLEGATYPDGTPVAAAMFWAEFGHEGRFPAPPRPYFRVMISQESPDWPKKMAALSKAFNFDGSKVLKAMGEDIAGALRQSIINMNDPPLSATTLVLRKRFGNNPGAIGFKDVLSAQHAAASGQEQASETQAKPLVWTGHALDSVGYEVKR